MFFGEVNSLFNKIAGIVFDEIFCQKKYKQLKGSERVQPSSRARFMWCANVILLYYRLGLVPNYLIKVGICLDESI